MANYKRELTQAHKDKISAKMRGRKMSDETKQKISNAIKNAWASVPKTTTSNLWSVDAENNEDNTGNE